MKHAVQLSTPNHQVSIIRTKAVREGSFVFPDRRIENPEKAARLAEFIFHESDREMLVVVCVDSKCQPVSLEIIGIGNINTCLASPRDIFKFAILSNAFGIFLFHNHVSGDASESKEDILITRRIEKSANILDIKLLDHIILGYKDFVSLREKGYFEEQEESCYLA